MLNSNQLSSSNWIWFDQHARSQIRIWYDEFYSTFEQTVDHYPFYLTKIAIYIRLMWSSNSELGLSKKKNCNIVNYNFPSQINSLIYKAMYEGR